MKHSYYNNKDYITQLWLWLVVGHMTESFILLAGLVGLDYTRADQRHNFQNITPWFLLFVKWTCEVPSSFDIQISSCRSQRDLLKCQRWPWGNFIQPFGLGETVTPAGRKGFIKLSVSLIVLYQMPSDCLVVPSADKWTALIWYAYTNAQMHAQTQTKKGMI